MTMKVCIYSRTATCQLVGVGEDLGIFQQMNACRKYARSHGWTVVDEFADSAESGISEDRSAFQQMMKSSLSGDCPWDTVLAHDHARFFRDMVRYEFYSRRLAEFGVELRFVVEFDTPSLACV